MMNILNIPNPIGYKEGMAIQNKAFESALSQGTNTLMVLEHLPVFTLGNKAQSEDPNKLFKNQLQRVKDNNIQIENTDRGGHITYHGPGQLVMYPIMPIQLNNFAKFHEALEQVMISIADNYGIKLKIKKEPLTDPRGYYKDKIRMYGVWYNDKYKVGSIGLKLKEGISTHGFALNINTDLDQFRMIDPCGLPGYDVTSFQEITGKKYSMEEVKQIAISEFMKKFQLNSSELMLPDRRLNA